MVSGPIPTQPDRSTRVTAAISPSPKFGFPKGKKSGLTAGGEGLTFRSKVMMLA
jgi:hypothetical protein